MAHKTPDQRALPKSSEALSRSEAWDKVLDNERLVRFVVEKFVRKATSGRSPYYGYTYQALFDELLSTAYEAAMVAAETYDPAKGFTFSTYAEKVIWRDLTDELTRWRAHTAVDGDREGSLDLRLEFEDFDLEDEGADPADRDWDAVFSVEKVREALTTQEFLVLVLTSQGRTPKEISEALGLFNGHARVVLCRARGKARAVLEGAA